MQTMHKTKMERIPKITVTLKLLETNAKIEREKLMIYNVPLRTLFILGPTPLNFPDYKLPYFLSNCPICQLHPIC